jgi:hypothetical protein
MQQVGLVIQIIYSFSLFTFQWSCSAIIAEVKAGMKDVVAKEIVSVKNCMHVDIIGYY